MQGASVKGQLTGGNLYPIFYPLNAFFVALQIIPRKFFYPISTSKLITNFSCYSFCGHFENAWVRSRGIFMWQVWNNLMEFLGIPWNSVENFLWNSVWYRDMEFHGILQNIIYGILWTSMKVQLHGIPLKTTCSRKWTYNYQYTNLFTTLNLYRIGYEFYNILNWYYYY